MFGFGKSKEEKRQLDIIAARRDFIQLSDGEKSTLSKMKEHLSDAGVDEKALDPRGQQSAEVMKALSQAVHDIYSCKEIPSDNVNIAAAREKFKEFLSGMGSSDGMSGKLNSVQYYLKASGADEAALSPQGNQSAEEMKKIVKAFSDYYDGKKIELDNPQIPLINHDKNICR
jgi:hypothetical protein